MFKSVFSRAGRVLTLCFFMLTIPIAASFAGGKAESLSEVVVRRVDSNQLIDLRVYIDGKMRGRLRLGETKVIPLKNGYHTIRVGFEDYQARSSEVAQFKSYNTTHVFSVTDTSIVLVSEQPLQKGETPEADLPLNIPPSYAGDIGPTYIDEVSRNVLVNPATGVVQVELQKSAVIMDNSIRSAFDKATKKLKKKSRIAIINVDSDNKNEANYILEEITLLSVNSPKNYFVIDRRWVDAIRSKNSIGVPSFENDYILRLLGELMGADFIITGRLDGPGDFRRLRIKAIEVQTGKLVGDSSERV